MSRLLGALARLRDLLSPAASSARTDEEFRFHLDMETDKLVREGLSRAEARRRAAATFGGVQHHREEIADRRGGWMGEAGRNLRHAARSLRRSPAFTVTAVTTLGLGFVLAAATLSVLNAYLARALPYEDVDRLYHVSYAPPGPVEPRGMSRIDWSALQDVVEAPITASSATYYATGGATAVAVRGLAVSRGFVPGLGVPIVRGRHFADGDFQPGAERTILIGHALWLDHLGGDSTVIGRTLRFEREASAAGVMTARVIGVVAPGFWFGRDSRDVVDFLTPLSTPFTTYMVKVREGVSPERAEARLTAVARSTASWIPDAWPGVRLQRVHARYVESIRPVLRALSVAAGVVLAITAVNVAVLLLLRSLRRRNEVAVRMALGASRASLGRMYLAEVGLLCGSAVVGASVTAVPLMHVLGEAIETQLGRPAPDAIGVSPAVFLSLGVVGLLVAVILAAIPLVTMGRDRIADALRGASRFATAGGGVRRLRFALVAAEIAGSFALLTGCGLMIASAARLSDTRLGMDAQGLLRARVVLRAADYSDASAYQRFYQDATARIANAVGSTPVFGAVTPYWEPPPQDIESQRGVAGAQASLMRVGPGYFGIARIPIQAGREFLGSDALDSEPVAIVSASLAARLWPGVSPLGQRVRALEPAQPGVRQGAWRTVVGVAADVRQAYDDQTTRDVYVPFLQDGVGRFSSFLIRSSLPSHELFPVIRGAIGALDPRSMVYEPRAVADEDRRLAQARFTSSLLAAFAALAGLLAAVGIYGVVAYAVKEREREMAVRLAVGANPAAILRLFARSGLALIGGGLVGGIVGALWIGQAMSSQLFGVEPVDLPTIAGAALLLGAVGLVASLVPARRAAKADPVVLLKD